MCISGYVQEVRKLALSFARVPKLVPGAKTRNCAADLDSVVVVVVEVVVFGTLQLREDNPKIGETG
jgi:hypothetical protein